MPDDTALFESHRPSLLGLAYRMLGDFHRAEDIVQEAWLRWDRYEAAVESPKAFLITIVTRLCLNELGSAPRRREDPRGTRLPEPISLEQSGLRRLETLDDISMAFLVLLQRLTPAERAVLLLHDVFDFEHGAIARLVAKSEPTCRQLLARARRHVAKERRTLTVMPEEHRRLLRAFLAAAATGDAAEIAKLLAEDVVLIVDAGSAGGHFGRVRNLPGPLGGAKRVAAFVAAVTPQGAADLTLRECLLNGQPAVVVSRAGRPMTAILLAVADAEICGIFMHADPDRLGHVEGGRDEQPVS